MRSLGHGKEKRNMNLYRHGMIFSTFLGSCLCIGLLAASLGTRYWIVSNAVRPTSPKSDGEVHFGLFRGEKNLTVGIGWRAERFEGIYLQQVNFLFMMDPLWIAWKFKLIFSKEFNSYNDCLYFKKNTDVFDR